MGNELLILFLIALSAFVLIVTIGVALLKIVGFSTGKAVVITLSFLFCGIWNPIGWIVLATCIYLQYKEVKQAMLERAPTQPSVLTTGRV